MNNEDFKEMIFIWLIFLLPFAATGAITGYRKHRLKKEDPSDGVIDKKSISRLISEGGNAYNIIKPVWSSVSIYDNWNKYENDLKSFSQEQRSVLAILRYEAEINNGGHDQFYFNSTGIVWEDALNAFEKLGMIEYYDVLKESVKRLGGKPSKDRVERQSQLEKLKPVFEDLDNRFYDLNKIKSINQFLLSHISQNKSKFYCKGNVLKTTSTVDDLQMLTVNLRTKDLPTDIKEKYDIATLEDRLVQALSKSHAGSYDGNDIDVDGGDVILYMYGADAEKMYEAITSVLKNYPLCKGASILCRYGKPGAEIKMFAI